jgi:hypothetical protein
MADQIAAGLLVYGPLGIISLISLMAAWKLYRDREADRARYVEAQKEWEARYVTKAETWMMQYHELAKSMNAVVEALNRRYVSRRRNS